MPNAGSLTVTPNDAVASKAWTEKGAAANPQELNRYSYVNNNPVGAGDPTGHCVDVMSCTLEGAAIGSVVEPGGGTAVGAAVGFVVGAAITLGVAAGIAYVATEVAKDGEETKAGPSDSQSPNEPISGNVKRLPEELLDPPSARGKAPTVKQDNTPVEIHHVGQDPNGPFEEMDWKTHRGKGNDIVNHPNKGKPSKVDRTQFNRDKKHYWENEWDRGRWNSGGKQ